MSNSSESLAGNKGTLREDGGPNARQPPSESAGSPICGSVFLALFVFLRASRVRSVWFPFQRDVSDECRLTHLSLSGGGVFVWSSCVFVYIGVNSQQERKMKEEISEHDG